MHTSRATMLAALALFTLILAGCGSEDGDSDDGGNSVPGMALAPFTDKVKACTPYLLRSNPTAGSSILETWNGWNPRRTNTVLGKLFDPGIGDEECIHTQVDILDSHIQLVNTFVDDWGTTGTYSRDGMTAVVDTGVTTVTIPFLNADSPPMERLVTLMAPARGLTVRMAFARSGTGQTVISQYTDDDASGVYYAWFLGDKAGIWHASVGTRKVQLMWEGNTTDKTFKISACTDAAGLNWEAMGGGSIAPQMDEMAIMARNHATNLSADEYYVTTTTAALESGAEQTIQDSGLEPPEGTGILAYVTEGNSLCLGFLGAYEYPDDVDELAWEED